jgi:hypothetical protein
MFSYQNQRGSTLLTEHHKDSNSVEWLAVNYSLVLNNSTIVIANTTGQQNAVNTIPIKFSIEKGRVRLRIITLINPISNKLISPYDIKQK